MAEKKKTRRRKNLRTHVFDRPEDQLKLTKIVPSWGKDQKIAVLWANQNKLLDLIKTIVDNG